MKKWISIIVFTCILFISYGFQTGTTTQNTDTRNKDIIVPSTLLVKKTVLLE